MGATQEFVDPSLSSHRKLEACYYKSRIVVVASIPACVLDASSFASHRKLEACYYKGAAYCGGLPLNH
jgi:hypothetical protein